MKLIIDIGESYYKEIKENKNTNAYKYAPYKLIANGKPLQTEYEEIKAEIDNIRDVEVTDGTVYVSSGDVYEILDNHVSKLKGE